MNLAKFAAAVVLGLGVTSAALADHKPVLVYTGNATTLVVDRSQGPETGAVLYNYKQFDAAYNTSLKGFLSSKHYYYLQEDQYPDWYWRVAKHPSYCYHRCHCHCLGYRVDLIYYPPNGPYSYEKSFYAQRQSAGAFYPLRSAAAEADARDPRRQ